MPCPLTNKIPRQPPKVIHVIVRQHVSEQVADPLARRNLSIDPFAAREDFLQRPISQQISSNFAQRLARIKHIAVRIHSGKHRRIALKVTEAQQGLDRPRGAVDRLRTAAPPFDDLVHQRLILRIFQQRQVGHFLHLRGLPSNSFASSRFSSTFGSAAGFESGFVGSAASASRLTTSPVTARRIPGLRSNSVPLVISRRERYLHSKRAASANSSMSGRSVGSPPVMTIESVSFRIRFSNAIVSLVGNSSLKTSGSFCVQ